MVTFYTATCYQHTHTPNYKILSKLKKRVDQSGILTEPGVVLLFLFAQCWNDT